MSREQGPYACVGMRPAAIATGRRHLGAVARDLGSEAAT
jgi:hypothetical protein